MVMNPVQVLKRNRTSQSGVAAVEFGLIAMLLFTLMLGIFEFGRLMYLWNTVQEVTRKAAREAVVRDFSVSARDAIQREAIFQAGSSGTVYLPAGGEVSNLRVHIQYLNADREPVSPPDFPEDNISACLKLEESCIRFVEASVCQGNDCDPVKYDPMIGLFSSLLDINIPLSTVVMPAESLGYHP